MMYRLTGYPYNGQSVYISSFTTRKTAEKEKSKHNDWFYSKIEKV